MQAVWGLTPVTLWTPAAQVNLLGWQASVLVVTRWCQELTWSVTLHRERMTGTSIFGPLRTPPHVFPPLADFNLYSFTMINYNHKCNITAQWVLWILLKIIESEGGLRTPSDLHVSELRAVFYVETLFPLRLHSWPSVFRGLHKYYMLNAETSRLLLSSQNADIGSRNILGYMTISRRKM